VLTRCPDNSLWPLARPMQLNRPWIFALAIVFFASGCSGSNNSSADSPTSPNKAAGQSVSLTGAGSTFVTPAMSKWAYAYTQAHPDVSINYQSVGSGAGIGQFEAGTVDFGATDVAMSDSDLKSAPEGAVQIPMITGCTVVAYNVPGVANGLKLSGDVIADIFLGTIAKWSDPRIVSQNPGVTLPDLPVAVIHRADSSGTTYIFTDYLCSVSPAWNAGPGKNKSPKWPTGVGGKGSEGVSGLIKRTPGSIGYVELAYAMQTKLTYGPVRNKSGKYVDPSVESTTAAANSQVRALTKDIRVSIVDCSAPDGYPIAGFTYAILSKKPKEAPKGKALVEFLNWVLGPGQDMAKELNYAPLPKSIADINKAALAEVQTK